MAISNIDTRKLILPWDDAGILGGLDHYLKIPEDVRLHAGWIFAIGPDKTHVLQTDASGNLNVAVQSSVASTSNVGLLDHSGNPITNTNPLPVSEHSSAVAAVSNANYVNVNGTGGTTVFTAMTSATKITCLEIEWMWIHVSTTYPNQIHWWLNLVGNVTGNVYRLYTGAYYLTADPGNGPIVTAHMTFPHPIDLAKIGNGTETFNMIGYNDTQQNQVAITYHGYA